MAEESRELFFFPIPKRNQKNQDEEMQLLADALHPSAPILPPLPAPPGAGVDMLAG